MQTFFLEHYLWLKSLHVIAVIAWMAGLLYLPRLFVYHAQAQTGSESAEMLKVMERRLFKFIMNPASILVWVFGLMMIYGNWDILKTQGWFHFKLLLVVLMTGLHHVYGAWLKKFARDENTKSDKFYRYANEIPTALMIIIVVLAVVEPF